MGRRQRESKQGAAREEDRLTYPFRRTVHNDVSTKINWPDDVSPGSKCVVHDHYHGLESENESERAKDEKGKRGTHADWNGKGRMSSGNSARGKRKLYILLECARSANLRRSGQLYWGFPMDSTSATAEGGQEALPEQIMKVLTYTLRPLVNV